MTSVFRLHTTVLEALSRPSASVIFLHGLGDTAEGWSDVMEHQFRTRLPHVRFVLPTANEYPITLNQGFRCTAWHDITELNEIDKGNVFLDENEALVQDLIQEEVKKGIDPSRILIGGFSQGCAMSLSVGLKQEKPLAGVLGLSGYLPNRMSFAPNKNSLAVPTLILHGDADRVVHPSFHMNAVETLKKLGVSNLNTKMYSGLGHSSSQEELNDALNFVSKCLP